MVSGSTEAGNELRSARARRTRIDCVRVRARGPRARAMPLLRLGGRRCPADGCGWDCISSNIVQESIG